LVSTEVPSRTAVIVDEHPLWLDAIEQLLDQLYVNVVGRAAGRREAVELLEQNPPDMLIADLAAISDDATDSATDTCTALVRARELNPDMKCIVLADTADPAVLGRVFRSGARAVCAKRTEPDDLATAIRQSFNNSIQFAPPPRVATAAETAAAAVRVASSTLTKREIEILRLTADGHSNSQLAKMLWVTEQTVKFHLSNTYRKLGVANRTEASRWAQLNGIVSEGAAARPRDVAPADRR